MTPPLRAPAPSGAAGFLRARTPDPDPAHPFGEWVRASANMIDGVYGAAVQNVSKEDLGRVKILLRRARFLVNRQATTGRDLSYDRLEVEAILDVLRWYVDDDAEDVDEIGYASDGD